MAQQTVKADIHHLQHTDKQQVTSNVHKDDIESSAPAVVARYAYEKFGYSVEKGEELTLLNKTNPDWWEVRKISGEVGFVPAVYMNNIKTSDIKVVKLHKKKSIELVDTDKFEQHAKINLKTAINPTVKTNSDVKEKPVSLHDFKEHSMITNKTKQEPNSNSSFDRQSHDSSDGKENNIFQRKNVENSKKIITRTNSERERMYRAKSLPDSQWPKDNFKSHVTRLNSQRATVKLGDNPKHSGSLDMLADPQRKNLRETSTKQNNIPANITDWTMKMKLEPRLNLGGSDQRYNMARTTGSKSPAEKHASLWQRSFPVAKRKPDKKEPSVALEIAELVYTAVPMQITACSDIKDQHLKHALKADVGPDASLVSWSSANLPGKGDVLSCKLECVSVTYQQNGREQTVSYVAKINPRNNIPGFEEMTKSIIKREAIIYSEIAPRLNSVMKSKGQEELKIPKCLYMNMDESPEIIIMEDLYAAGYKKANKKQGLNLNETKLVITALAEFHAASIILDREINLGRLYPGLIPQSGTEENNDEKTILENIVKTGIGLLRQLGGYEAAVQWLVDVQPRVQNMFKSCIESCGMLKVLCHGDCLIDNILFRYDKEGSPVDVRLINYQACVLASPALDLNYLLFSSLNGSNRHPNTETLLALYTKVLQQVLSTSKQQISISHEKIQNEYKSKNPYGILIGLSSVSAMVSELRDIPVVLGSDKGVAAAMDMFSVEWQARQSILLQKNPALSPRLAAIADDIINYNMAPLESSM